MKPLRTLLVALAALAVPVLASAHAQTLLVTLGTPNPQTGAWFGSSLAMGDVNGDGRADIAAGTAKENVNGNDGQGRVYVFSGADGSVIFTLDTPNPQTGAGFGYSLAMGDVNGDGKADIAVGTAKENVNGNDGQGRVYVFSGADGSVIFTLDTPNPQTAWFGYSLATGDVNGDGRADIAVGAPYEEVGTSLVQGRAYVFSGADGSLLFALDTPRPQWPSAFGFSISMGDVNGDGRADIAVGAPAEGLGRGGAYVFSGADGAVLFTLDTPNPQTAWFGYSLATGDVNGDGRADIAVGAPFENVSSNLQQGRAYVFSNVDGSLLFAVDTPNPQPEAWLGFSVGIGDVNGDGRADIAVGQPGLFFGGSERYKGSAHVFSGAGGSLLLTLDSPNAQLDAVFGLSVAVDDVNGDRKADIIVGAPFEGIGTNLKQGRAYVFSGADGSLPLMLNTPLPQAGAGFGYSLAMGDVNGDGKADIAVGARYEDVASNLGQGRVYVLPAQGTLPAAGGGDWPTRSPGTRWPFLLCGIGATLAASGCAVLVLAKTRRP